jgi:hypothetical protein
MKSRIMLWSGLIAGPLAWFINLNTNFALAPLACTAGAKPALYLVSALTVAVALAGAYLSWTQWQSDEAAPASQSTAIQQRRRAMALSGVVLSGFSALVILAQTIPNVMLAGCE